MTLQVMDTGMGTPYCATTRNGPAIFKDGAIMVDAASVAKAYLETWNESDAPRRREVLNQYWAQDAEYVDPLMSGVGHDQISGLVSAVHERFPGFRFRLTGTPNGHGDYVRLTWSLGPDGVAPPIEGSDVVHLRRGKVGSVIGFIDKAP